jgi:LmbE family N-acetylglucosaminyl deacetylase
MSKRTILAVFPHGDDEVLGMGGVLHRLSKSDSVTVTICMGSKDARTDMQMHAIDKAKTILGYQNLMRLNLSEHQMYNRQHQVFKILEGIVTELQPEICFIPFWGDVHQDHLLVFSHMTRACRTWGPAHVKSIFCCDIISSTDQGFPQPGMAFVPNVFQELDEDDVEAKCRALECYESELRLSPHPRSRCGLLNRAKHWGSACKTAFAEAFVCTRLVKNI